MTSRRIIIGRLAAFVLGSSFVSACTTNQENKSQLSADVIAQHVAKHYGESSPVIITVTNTVGDPPPHDPMYLIALKGHFKKDNIVASSLSFSALASRMYVWNIHGYSASNQEIWMEKELPA